MTLSGYCLKKGIQESRPPVMLADKNTVFCHSVSPKLVVFLLTHMYGVPSLADEPGIYRYVSY